MNCSEVPKLPVSELSEEKFLTDYVARNQPLIVTGALEDWDIPHVWTPRALEKRFGDQLVQVYDNYFTLQSIMPLRQYLADNFGRETVNTGKLPYVRWYTKLREVEFCWADDTFNQLKDQWMAPTFLPDSKYLLPHTSEDEKISPVTDLFPAKGLFISPRGARTSLHVDPWGSCAVLCQLYGTKRWYFYGPEQAQYLQNESGTVDVTRPDMRKFPSFSMARLFATCRLGPGDVVYIPHGWFHQVECESDSVSLTWNFVHRTTQASFVAWLTDGCLSEFDESVLRFFYRIAPGRRVVDDVLARLQDRRVA